MAPNNYRRTVSCDSSYMDTFHTKYAVTKRNMGTQVAYNPYHQQGMPLKKLISVEENYKRIDKIHDEPDNPTSGFVERNSSEENNRNQELFDVMKYEVNRLNSFNGKWPLCYIKPKDLAENGFFYLQSEDKVQCAFCNVVIDDWNVGDKPVKKHMMKQPKCKYLMTADAGNIPYIKPKPAPKNVSKCIPNVKTRNTLPHKPKYPRMSDVKNRLLSYRDWPLLMLSSRQLAECGLFYTGVGDAVTCFYCGGSLGNWELNDDPWVEHEKFYPECGFLDLARTRSKPTPSFASANPSYVKSNSAPARSDSVPNEVIRQACEIFPDTLVQKVAIQHYRETGKHFTSLHDICESVLQFEKKEQSPSKSTNTMPALNDSHMAISGNVKSNSAPVDSTNNTKITCKICLDGEINIVFEPCHHQVACEKCSLKVTKCPLCRSIITNRIKVFWG